MFTIKATYRNETRKFTFADTNVFPSFHELYLQLYRVFPISHNYYLSKLLFSPDSSKSRILLAKEVHSAEEYDRCITQYGGRSWANPLLKFSVYDETPHKLPNMSSSSDLKSRSESQASSTPRLRTFAFAPSSASECSTSNYSPIPFSHIPPPPIIFSTIPSPVPPSLRSSEGTPKPPPQQAQHVGSPTLVAPTVVAELRSDMKNMSERLEGRMDEYMSKLKDIEAKLKALDIERPAPQAPSSPIVIGKSEPEATTMFPPLCKYTFCVMCGSIKQGPWYDCQQCALKVCTDCNERPSKCPCKDENGLLSLQRAHTWIKQTCPSCPTAAPGTDIPAVVNAAPAPAPDVDVPMQSPHIRAGPDVAAPPSPSVSAAEPTTTLEPVMPVHFGIRCDACQTMPVQGVRHKCLDCPDHDLCTECITSGAAERHNPFHEFFEITELGRVVVHTVYQGNSERSAPDTRRAPVPSPPPPPAPAEPVVHFASCNLCDSRIRGNRYKCLDCPDYDTCDRCFDITPEHHPQHAFVKIQTSDQFIRRNVVDRAMHYATCNSCEKGIFGIRYKCMHPECPDYDLCDDCEALPITVHPANHPLLKMRDVNTVIPTVYRVGGTRLVDSPPTRTSSFSERNGSKDEFLRNVVTEDKSRELSPEIKPPSPFFFATESERSVSPPAMDYRGTTSCFPPLPPPPIVEYRISPSEVRTTPASSRPSFLDHPPHPFYFEPPPSPPMMIPGAMPPFTQLPQVPQVHQWQPSEFWRAPDSPFSRALDADSQAPSPARLPSPPRNWPFMVRAPPSPPRLPPIAVGMRVPSPPSPPPIPVPVRIPSPPLPPRQLPSAPSARFSVSGRILPSPPSWANYRVRFAATPSEPDFSYLEESQTRREVVSPVDDASTSRVQLPPPPPDAISPFHTSNSNPFNSHMSSYSPGFWHGGHLMDERSSTKQDDEESSFEKDLLRALEVSERLNSKRSPSPVAVPPRESPLVGELLNSPENTGTSAQTYPELFKPSLIEFLMGPDFAQNPVASPPAREPPVEESPLIGDLLNRPASMIDRDECCSVCSKRSLASILDGTSTAKPQEAKIETFIPPLDNEEEEMFIPPSSRTLNALLPEEYASPITQAEAQPELLPEPRLDATYIDDRSVPDGQIFPPGAEFVKSWRMMNTGNVEWPEGTELVFVGGDCLERIKKNAAARVGKAGTSESVDVWTGELKAPEKEGRYVSYYRLRDDQGVVFGDSIWLDIAVKDGYDREEEDEKADSGSSCEEYKSMSSSSVIVMPTAAASVYTTSSVAGSSLPPSSPDGDSASENGSSTSSVSLLSVPDEDNEDDEDWAETRESFASPSEHVEEAEEYVVLYDSESD